MERGTRRDYRPHPERRPPSILALEGVTRRFGDLVALDGLSFRVAPGQMFGFVGSNGAGKTTAMRIIMGIDEPDAGTVRFDGQPIGREDRRRFGYMPEERGLYPKTPADRQLAYLGRLHGRSKADATAAADRWLERLGLHDRRSDPVEKLSLGNQQRVQLAAALVHDPDLLVLDEPFSSLDPMGVDALSEVLLEQAAAGVPVLFSSHQLELVERLCDAVVIIDSGRLAAAGTVEELRTRGRARTLQVDVATDEDWFRGLRGVKLLHRGDRTLLELDDGVDDQAVLEAARQAGPVRHFGMVRPTLAELYREVVVKPRAGEVEA